jgi:hypothetical protein
VPPHATGSAQSYHTRTDAVPSPSPHGRPWAVKCRLAENLSQVGDLLCWTNICVAGCLLLCASCRHTPRGLPSHITREQTPLQAPTAVHGPYSVDSPKICPRLATSCVGRIFVLLAVYCCVHRAATRHGVCPVISHANRRRSKPPGASTSRLIYVEVR